MNIKLDAARFIDEAIEVLEEHGWCQDEGTDSDGRHCIFGAFDVAGVRLDLCGARSVAERAAEREIQALVGANLGIIAYNDTDGRTKEEVIDLLQHAAKNLRNSAKPE